MLANKFSYVCGHKGYSYDFYQENERRRIDGPKMDKKFDRLRVRADIMDEIGYEECDYISKEADWSWWNKTYPGGRLHGVPVELHVPCREPIDHLMSMCHHNNITFGCEDNSEDNLSGRISKCLMHITRFDNRLSSDFNISCFQFENTFTTYFDYMSDLLQERRFQSVPYIGYFTNTKRNIANECIWENEDLKKRVKTYLLGHQYYQFCSHCIGSENEISSVLAT